MYDCDGGRKCALDAGSTRAGLRVAKNRKLCSLWRGNPPKRMRPGLTDPAGNCALSIHPITLPGAASTIVLVALHWYKRQRVL